MWPQRLVERRSGRTRHDPFGRPGLHDHDAHAVGDDVVQVACDPGPLVEDRLAGEQLALGLGADRPLLERVEAKPAVVHHFTGDRRGEVERGDADDGGGGELLGGGQHPQHGDHGEKPATTAPTTSHTRRRSAPPWARRGVHGQDR